LKTKLWITILLLIGLIGANLTQSRLISVAGAAVENTSSHTQTSPISAFYPNFAVIEPQGQETMFPSPSLSPLLRRIAACESTGDPNGTPRQFNSDGSLLWGNDPKTGKPIERDCGEFQENQWVWSSKEKQLDLNVCKSATDNITFALWLYDRYGTSPWDASKNCWKQ
jgi:hypothetical protein